MTTPDSAAKVHTSSANSVRSTNCWKARLTWLAIIILAIRLGNLCLGIGSGQNKNNSGIETISFAAFRPSRENLLSDPQSTQLTARRTAHQKQSPPLPI